MCMYIYICIYVCVCVQTYALSISNVQIYKLSSVTIVCSTLVPLLLDPSSPSIRHRKVVDINKKKILKMASKGLSTHVFLLLFSPSLKF